MGKNKQPSSQPKVEIVNAVVDGVDNMLNVRTTPEVKDGNVITTIKKGTYIQVVDPKKAETKEFYKIVVKDPEVKGYAMKKYIKII